MAKKKTAKPPVDTSAGQAAYALAIQHRAALDPRLPNGTIDDLGIDLTTLGAPPAPVPVPAPAPVPAPSLADALHTTEALVSAIHEAVLAAKPKPDVRKAYGAGSKATGKDVNRVLVAADAILARAQAEPSEALSLGILPADVTALGQSVSSLSAAQASTAAGKAAGGTTAKAKKAAAVRMHEAVARIAGVGVLAFALDSATRAQFEALRVKKK
jgi:hypothetical protein